MKSLDRGGIYNKYWEEGRIFYKLSLHMNDYTV